MRLLKVEDVPAGLYITDYKVNNDPASYIPTKKNAVQNRSVTEVLFTFVSLMSGEDRIKRTESDTKPDFTEKWLSSGRNMYINQAIHK